jgi:phospholipid/cholesterol/gamma-HCH transport system permease protein
LRTGINTARAKFVKSPEDVLLLSISGSWRREDSLLDQVSLISDFHSQSSRSERLEFDTANLTDWDSSLPVFLKKIISAANEKEIEIRYDTLPEGVKRVIRLSAAVPERKDTVESITQESLLSRIGVTSIELTKSSGEIIEFLGEVTLSFFRLIRMKARFRVSDLFQQIQETGAFALPIVSLISFLLGVILAFVGAVQLKQFGAQIFVADLVGIAMTREMAPMMTAIIIAGRSGASFAAQLGTMTVNEEIDALKTMGISPIDFLVLPRLIALSFMVPLLVLYADFLGIIGGAAVGILMLDVSFTQYFEQTKTALEPIHFLLGIIKGTIYGGLVAIAGCMRGIQCGRSASAVGSATTSAVVTGIVFIIIASAVTTIIYDILGL